MWLTRQHNGRANGTPQTAPARIDRYIEPGREKACKLGESEALGGAQCALEGEFDPLKICYNKADNGPSRVESLEFLKEGVESFQLIERGRDV